MVDSHINRCCIVASKTAAREQKSKLGLCPRNPLLFENPLTSIFVSDSDDLSSRSTSRKNSVELMTSGSALSDDSTTSLVVRLRSPTPSDLARKRQLRYNPPPKGVKRGKGKEKGIPRIYQLVSA